MLDILFTAARYWPPSEPNKSSPQTPTHFLNIYFNIIVLFPCPKWQISFIFPNQNCVYTSLLCMLHDLPPEKEHYYECLIVQYSPLLSFFLPSFTLSLPSSAEFMNRWSMHLPPPTICLHGVGRNNFTFSFLFLKPTY